MGSYSNSKMSGDVFRRETPLNRIILAMGDLEEARQKLEEATQNFNKADIKVQEEFKNLDPNTRTLIKGMLSQLDEKDNFLNKENSEGRTR